MIAPITTDIGSSHCIILTTRPHTNDQSNDQRIIVIYYYIILIVIIIIIIIVLYHMIWALYIIDSFMNAENKYIYDEYDKKKESLPL